MKNKKILLLSVVLAGLLVALYAYNEYNRAPVNTAAATPDVTITDAALTSEFEQDEAGATGRYVNKLLRVQGNLLDLSTSEPTTAQEKESYTVVIGSKEGATTIRCSMDSGFSPQQTPVMVGDKITVQGVCSGYNKDELLGADIVLVRCAVIKN